MKTGKQNSGTMKKRDEINTHLERKLRGMLMGPLPLVGDTPYPHTKLHQGKSREDSGTLTNPTGETESPVNSKMTP